MMMARNSFYPKGLQPLSQSHTPRYLSKLRQETDCPISQANPYSTIVCCLAWNRGTRTTGHDLKTRSTKKKKVTWQDQRRALQQTRSGGLIPKASRDRHSPLVKQERFSSSYFLRRAATCEEDAGDEASEKNICLKSFFRHFISLL